MMYKIAALGHKRFLSYVRTVKTMIRPHLCILISVSTVRFTELIGLCTNMKVLIRLLPTGMITLFIKLVNKMLFSQEHSAMVCKEMFYSD